MGRHDRGESQQDPEWRKDHGRWTCWGAVMERKEGGSSSERARVHKIRLTSKKQV